MMFQELSKSNSGELKYKPIKKLQGALMMGLTMKSQQ